MHSIVAGYKTTKEQPLAPPWRSSGSSWPEWSLLQFISRHDAIVADALRERQPQAEEGVIYDAESSTRIAIVQSASHAFRIRTQAITDELNAMVP